MRFDLAFILRRSAYMFEAASRHAASWQTAGPALNATCVATASQPGNLTSRRLYQVFACPMHATLRPLHRNLIFQQHTVSGAVTRRVHAHSNRRHGIPWQQQLPDDRNGASNDLASTDATAAAAAAAPPTIGGPANQTTPQQQSTSSHRNASTSGAPPVSNPPQSSDGVLQNIGTSSQLTATAGKRPRPSLPAALRSRARRQNGITVRRLDVLDAASSPASGVAPKPKRPAPQQLPSQQQQRHSARQRTPARRGQQNGMATTSYTPEVLEGSPFSPPRSSNAAAAAGAAASSSQLFTSGRQQSSQLGPPHTRTQTMTQKSIEVINSGAGTVVREVDVECKVTERTYAVDAAAASPWDASVSPQAAISGMPRQPAALSGPADMARQAAAASQSPFVQKPWYRSAAAGPNHPYGSMSPAQAMHQHPMQQSVPGVHVRRRRPVGYLEAAPSMATPAPGAMGQAPHSQPAPLATSNTSPYLSQAPLAVRHSSRSHPKGWADPSAASGAALVDTLSHSSNVFRNNDAFRAMRQSAMEGELSPDSSASDKTIEPRTELWVAVHQPDPDGPATLYKSICSLDDDVIELMEQSLEPFVEVRGLQFTK